MRERCRELVTSDEPTILPEPLLDAIVVEDGQSDGRLANPASTNQSDRSEIFHQGDDLLDQIVTSEAGYRCPGR
jgi:hypothetical protein